MQAPKLLEFAKDALDALLKPEGKNQTL